MSDFINTIDLLGDEVVLWSILDRSITEFKDNVVKTVGEYAFESCTALTIVDLPNVDRIYRHAFEKCANLTTVILRYSTRVCQMPYSDALNSTPIKSGTGYIYVPRALIEDYKVSNYWSHLANQFRALEDYTVDGTTTGELDPTKI